MLSFKLDAWAALAPGIETREAWLEWSRNRQPVSTDPLSVPLKQVPSMLRRRLSPLGKCAFSTALELVDVDEKLPCVFVSRHGETPQTLALLQDLVQGEVLSPTAFSLSVHNAICGLFSIARKDVSAVTALAAVEGTALQGILEACGQLQSVPRVLCVIYETPLPELYREYEMGVPFTYSLALLLSRETGEAYQLKPVGESSDESSGESGAENAEPIPDSSPEDLPETLQLIRYLLGDATEWQTRINEQPWRISRADQSC